MMTCQYFSQLVFAAPTFLKILGITGLKCLKIASINCILVRKIVEITTKCCYISKLKNDLAGIFFCVI